MKIYIAGKITGLKNYEQVFNEAHKELESKGHTIMNPTILPEGFEHHEYIHVCFAMIDVCDGVVFLNNWEESYGARLEHRYAESKGKLIIHQT